jgi:integrase
MATTKKRNAENKGLPARWQFRHNAYYYRVPPGQLALWDGKTYFRLGASLSDAYKVWATRMETGGNVRTVGDLLDRYALEVIPTKAPKTRESNGYALVKLREVFGAAPVGAIKPQMIYKYADIRSRKTKGADGRLRGGPITAQREIEVLSHAFTKAVEWGFVDKHPFRNELRFEGVNKPRTRYVEDWEVVEALKLKPRLHKGSVRSVQAYIKVKLLTGMRRIDLLRLSDDDLQEDGIHVTPSKTKKSSGKSVVYLWSDELRAAVDEAKAARPVESPYLFCTRKGECYVNEDGFSNGWDSMWQRFFARVVEETSVTEHFTEHDLRAKCASDAETLEHARALLAHADSSTTNRIYRRKVERVRPLR